MKTDDFPASLAVIKHFADTSECLFDLSLNWPRPRPVCLNFVLIFLTSRSIILLLNKRLERCGMLLHVVNNFWEIISIECTTIVL